MTAIAHVHGRQILDSRGNPTVEVEVRLEEGVAAGRPFLRVPRTGRTSGREARRRQDPLLGKGLEQAVAAVDGEMRRR